MRVLSTSSSLVQGEEKKIHTRALTQSHLILVEVEITILKYKSPLHFLKSGERRKENPHACNHSLTRLIGRGEGHGCVTLV